MKRILLILPVSLLLSNLLQAQNTAAAEPQSNFLEIFMVIVAIVLIFVIWGLSSILLTFAKQVFEKQKQTGAGKTAAMIVTLLFLSIGSFAQDAAVAAQQTKSAVNYGGLSATSFWLLAGVIVVEFLVIFVLVFNIQRLHAELLASAKKQTAPVTAYGESRLMQIWKNLDKKFFTRAAEKEADVMLDHDYDGIHELDNALPPWWKYGFYITILLAVVYLLRFHVWGNGPSPEQEYAGEMKQAHEQIQAYMAKTKDMVDENNVTLTDATGIEAGKLLYMKTCVACHGQKGEGTVGPNLTDDYWLHGGSMTNIFKTIKYGYPDKGMQAWQSQYSPKQMQQLSSFIKSLRGTNPPNAKTPQGDLYQEEGNQQKAGDSTAAKQVVYNN